MVQFQQHRCRIRGSNLKMMLRRKMTGGPDGQLAIEH
jgi:hypothetical protein